MTKLQSIPFPFTAGNATDEPLLFTPFRASAAVVAIEKLHP